MTPPKRRRGAVPPAEPVGEAILALLDPVLRRKTGMTVGLVGAWSEIVGQRLESSTRPEKLVWPPGIAAARGDRLVPATLVVACEGASALRLQHEAGLVVERVNTFFGFAAVDKLRIVQKPVPPLRPDRRPVLRELRAGEAESLDAMTARIEDPRLREALRLFGESVLKRQPMTKP